jgi:hypothetical protein
MHKKKMETAMCPGDNNPTKERKIVGPYSLKPDIANTKENMHLFIHV